jgi:hypothetical protein
MKQYFNVSREVERHHRIFNSLYKHAHCTCYHDFLSNLQCVSIHVEIKRGLNSGNACYHIVKNSVV